MRRIRQRIVQSTARIARIMINVPICRTFLRTVLYSLSPAGGRLSTATTNRPRIACVGMWCFAGLSYFL